MKLRSFVTTLAIALFTVSAHAQLGIYGTANTTRLGSTAAVSGSNWDFGPGAGIYYDFLHLGPIAVGADLRGSFLFGTNTRYRNALAGIRLAAKTPVLPIKPYIQGSVGVGGGKSTLSITIPGPAPQPYTNKFQYQVLGGLDYTFFPHLDWRVAEVGYGRMTGISSGTTAPQTTLLTISTGIVFRLH